MNTREVSVQHAERPEHDAGRAGCLPDAGSLFDSLNAGNGKLLADWRGKLSLQNGLQLNFSLMGTP